MIAAIVLAVLLHVLFIFGVVVSQHFKLVLPPEPAQPVRQSVSLRTLDAQQWASNRGEQNDRTAHRRTAPKPKIPPPPDKKPKGQVVAVAPGNDQVPNDSKYLAEHNNTVKKETRAKDTTPNYRNPMPHRTTTEPTPNQGQLAQVPQTSGNGGKGEDEKPQRDARKKQGALEIPDVKPRDRIAMKTPKDGQGPGLNIPNQPESDELHGNSSRLHLDPNGQTRGESAQEGSLGRAGNPGLANLIPSQATLDKIDGAAANDHLDGVEEGNETFLNTQEWKYAGFFNRVKQSVGTQWDPGDALRERDPTGNIYGGHDRYTVLAVTLTPDGALKEIHITKSSGVDFLDQEAVKAFEKAQPFPNPPPGLIASDQTVHFEFGFFLEMSGMPHLRLFRPGP